MFRFILFFFEIIAIKSILIAHSGQVKKNIWNVVLKPLHKCIKKPQYPTNFCIQLEPHSLPWTTGIIGLLVSMSAAKQLLKGFCWLTGMYEYSTIQKQPASRN